MKKKILSLAVLVLFTSTAMLFTGCPMNPKKGIVGVWAIQGEQFEAFICFTSDSKMFNAIKDNGKLVRSEPADYLINGNKLKIGNDEIEFTLKGDELTLKGDKLKFSEKTEVKFKRVSSPTEAEIKAAPVSDR